MSIEQQQQLIRGKKRFSRDKEIIERKDGGSSVREGGFRGTGFSREKPRSLRDLTKEPRRGR